MAIQKLALILKNPQNDDEFLLVKRAHPPKFDHQEYDSYVDSDLWDLPSTQLNPLQGESGSQSVVEVADLHLEEIDLKEFDFRSALNEIFEQIGFGEIERGVWKYFKHVKEPAFGPDLPILTVFITGVLAADDNDLRDICRWMSVQSCLNWLLEEYPPGVTLIPMRSRTHKPFHTTNLVVFAPEYVPSDSGDKSFIACGDALIVDPGCLSQFHEELLKVVSTLPRRLVVFVTHHHHDHVDGLSVIQKCNPDATLLARENTMSRISKDDWSLGYTSVSGDEEINIGGQTLKVIFAPGHTDGHMALLHVNTHSLIVGDHCVGQGSAVLDITSGGSMTEYFKTTYKFLELSPHSLIPMHGRTNLWPKHMLCGYLKNRRSREANILAAIEGGARTLFDIVANVYSEVDRRAWIAASSNVRLHVDHLAQQDKLPKDFSVQKFKNTCGLHFVSRWMLAYITGGFHIEKPSVLITVAVAVAGFAVFYSVKKEATQVESE